MVQEGFRGGGCLPACPIAPPQNAWRQTRRARRCSRTSPGDVQCVREIGSGGARESVCHTRTRLCLTHGGVLARRLWHSHTHSLTLSRTLTLTLTHTHTRKPPLSHTNTLSHTHTHSVLHYPASAQHNTPSPQLHHTVCYRDTSLIRNCFLLGPYSRPLPRALWWS